MDSGSVAMSNERRNDESEENVVDLERAIDIAGFGRYHAMLILICGVCLSIMISESMGISFVLPRAQCDLDLDNTYKGLLSGVSFFGMIAGAHAWGFCADTLGRKKVLLICLYGTWISSFTSSFSPNVEIFALFRFLTGFFLCGMSSTVYAYLSEFLPAKNRPVIITWTSSFIALAFFGIPAIAWILLPLNINVNMSFIVFRSWRLYIIVMGSGSLFVSFPFLRYPESPKFLTYVGKKEEALNVLRTIYSINFGKPKEEYPVKDILSSTVKFPSTSDSADENRNKACNLLRQFVRTVWRQTSPLIYRPYGYTTMLFCILQFWIYATSAGIYLWTPQILNLMSEYAKWHDNETTTVCEAIAFNKVANITDDSADCKDTIDTAVYTSSLIIGGCYILAYVIVGGLVSLFGKKTIVALAILVSGLTDIGLYFAYNETLGIIFLSTFFAMSGTCISVLNAAVVDAFPTNVRAMAVSLALTCGRLGSALAGNIIGILMDSNCPVTLIGIGCILLLCCGLSFLIPRSTSTS